jgi:hypothetical protein
MESIIYCGLGTPARRLSRGPTIPIVILTLFKGRGAETDLSGAVDLLALTGFLEVEAIDSGARSKAT